MPAPTLRRGLSRRGSQLSLKSNPMKSDPQLQDLLCELDTILAPEQQQLFFKWQASFLERYEFFLEKEGIQKAEETDRTVLEGMEKFNKTLDKVQACVDEGLLSANRKVGVRAQTAVNRLKEGCVNMEQGLQKMMPNGNAEIKHCGYDKFQMAAVLVRDGFQVYGHIMKQSNHLQSLKKQVLEQVVDRQVLDAITYYQRQIKILCDVMADLGLMNVMLKTRVFAGDMKIAEETKEMEINAGNDSRVDLLMDDTESETTSSVSDAEEAANRRAAEMAAQKAEEEREKEELAEIERLIALEEAEIREQERITRETEEKLANLEKEQQPSKPSAAPETPPVDCVDESELKRRSSIQDKKAQLAALRLQEERAAQEKANKAEREREERLEAARLQGEERKKKAAAEKLAQMKKKEVELAAQKEAEAQRLREEEAAKELAEKKREERMAMREARVAKVAALKQEEEELAQAKKMFISQSARDLMKAEEDAPKTAAQKEPKVRSGSARDLMKTVNLYDSGEREQEPVRKKGMPPRSSSLPSQDAKAAIAAARAAKSSKKEPKVKSRSARDLMKAVNLYDSGEKEQEPVRRRGMPPRSNSAPAEDAKAAIAAARAAKGTKRPINRRSSTSMLPPGTAAKMPSKRASRRSNIPDMPEAEGANMKRASSTPSLARARKMNEAKPNSVRGMPNDSPAPRPQDRKPSRSNSSPSLEQAKSKKQVAEPTDRKNASSLPAAAQDVKPRQLVAQQQKPSPRSASPPPPANNPEAPQSPQPDQKSPKRSESPKSPPSKHGPESGPRESPRPASPKQATQPPSKVEPKPECSKSQRPPASPNASNEPATQQEKQNDDEDFIIFFDTKTESMGRLSRAKCIELGLLTVTTDKETGKECIEEAETKPKKRKSLMQRIARGLLGK